MLDQDTARALLALADAAGARVALVGDRHQLPAVGRGGVLDLAARYAAGPRASSSTESAASPIRRTPTCHCGCAPETDPARSSTSWCAAATS